MFRNWMVEGVSATYATEEWLEDNREESVGMKKKVSAINKCIYAGYVQTEADSLLLL